MKRKNTIMMILIITTLTVTGCGNINNRFFDVTTSLDSTNYETSESDYYIPHINNNSKSEVAMEYNYNSMNDTIKGDMECEIYYPPSIELNTEEYNNIKENSFINVSTQPLSTFAIDVDTGSYTNFRRMVNDGYQLENIPSGAIRIEEMINYFTYDFANKTTNDSEIFDVKYEIHDCPWNNKNKLLAINVQAGDIEINTKGNNFVYLIDTSGSMSYDDAKGKLAIKSFKLLTDTLTEKDTVSIVTYAGNAEVLLEGCSGSNKREIKKVLNDISFEGYTNGGGGIIAAYQVAEDYFIDGGNNRVIVASDGDMNFGITSQSDLVDLIEEKKESGVFLTTLGYGSGNYSDANMESIANAGNGNYYYIDCEKEAEYVLVEKLKQSTITVAKDVKIQVEFNPTKISSYRLLGYENRAMSADDFKNDKKDGGETGAGQQVTVLYELECSNTNKEIDLKYQGNRELTEAAQTNEILTLSLRYKHPNEDKSLLEKFVIEDKETSISKDYKFVCGIAELSMVLTNSEYKGTSSLDNSYDFISNNTKNDKRREECAELIDMINE